MTAFVTSATTPGTIQNGAETAAIRSNVRAFRDESFTVWRCGNCRSIHARDEVDLDHYYANYPFYQQKDDWRSNFVYLTFRMRLARAGVTRDQSILDYGCGSGLLVNFLRRAGYRDVTGYDAFNPKFNDKSIIEKRYDCVIAQDLVEHVLDSRGILQTFDGLVQRGGVILIGTPDADVIDLSNPKTHMHALHQPYHTHIFSKDALISAGQKLNWSVDRVYSTSYVNTVIPLLNLSFGFHYAACFDDTIDLAFEPVRINRKLVSPKTIYLALFGYFHAPETDKAIVFRAPK